MRERCYRCYRPQSLCFCEAIPQVDNRTHVLMLQHVGERSHAFNTARIVCQALCRCDLIAGHNRQIGEQLLPIKERAGLLYPSAHAPVLAELSAEQRPQQLVVIDGTWHQAKTIVRDVPQLQTLPCYRLSPSSPGQYRIRREPNAQSLSTLEATVAALRELEPETEGLDQLLAAFASMVETQLGQLAEHSVVRRRRPRQTGPKYLPFSLLQEAERLVVAYGEATPPVARSTGTPPRPVNWVAQRLGTEERFECTLRPESPLSAKALEHMRLTADDFEMSVSEEQFRQDWQQFLRRSDVLVVYHQRTTQLLQQIGAGLSKYLVLKSIFGNWRSGVRSMEQLLAMEGLAIPDTRGKSRAVERVAMAVKLVEHLRESNPMGDSNGAVANGKFAEV